MRAAVRRELENSKVVFIVYMVLRLFVAVALVFSIINGNYDSAFICVLVLVLFLLPNLVEHRLGVELPSVLEIVILLFIFAAEILGELQDYYIYFPYWDTMLHTTWGFLCAGVGFCLVDFLNRNKRFSFQLSPVFLAVVAFCFSMTVGVIWEFWEFACDYVIHTDMQKDTILHTISSVNLSPDGTQVTVFSGITDMSLNGESLGLGGYLDIGLYDTMEDLFVNFIGAMVFSIIGFFHVKSRGKSKIARQFIPRVKDSQELAAEEAELEEFLASVEEEEAPDKPQLPEKTDAGPKPEGAAPPEH